MVVSVTLDFMHFAFVRGKVFKKNIKLVFFGKPSLCLTNAKCMKPRVIDTTM